MSLSVDWGDRYNATTFNGFALPSEDPEYKNISLDFFGTDIIQSVGVNKAFNAGRQQRCRRGNH